MDLLRNLTTRQKLAAAAVLAVAVAFLIARRRRAAAAPAATDSGVSPAGFAATPPGQAGFFSDPFAPVAAAPSAAAQPDPITPAASIDNTTALVGSLGGLLDALKGLQGGINGPAGEAPNASPPANTNPAATVPAITTPATPATPAGVLRGVACQQHNTQLKIMNFAAWETWHLAAKTAGFAALTRAQRAVRWRAYVLAHGGCIP